MKRSILIFLAISSLYSLAMAQDFIGKAKVSLSVHDTVNAVQAFKDAVKANQKPGEADYYLGIIAFAQQHMDDAQGFLESAIRINDNNADAYSTLAQVYVKKKDISSALGAYRRATKLAPKDVNIATGFGLALLAADSVDAAIIQLTRAKDLDGNTAAIYAALGDAYQKQNVAPLAISNYQKAIEFAPQQLRHKIRLAEIYEKNRQYGEAVSTFETVIAADSNYADAYLSIGQILVRASSREQKRLAVAPLRKFVAKRPNSVEGATTLTKALFLTEDWVDCAAVAKKAVELDAKNPELWREYAYSLAETKDFKGAIVAFDKLKALNGFKPEDQTKYGNSLVGVGREDEALNTLLKAVELDSTNCDPYFNLGSLFMKKQDYANACKMFVKKIACDPKSVKSLSSYLNGAICYMQLKTFDSTRVLLNRSLEIYPEFLQARLWLARYFVQVDSLDRAKEQYDVVLQQAGQNPEKYKREMGEAYGMSGSYYFTVQKYAAAIDAFRKAVANGNDIAAVQLSWGQAVLQTLDVNAPADEADKKKAEAITHFRKSITQDPKNALAHLWLAQALVISRKEGADKENRVLQDEACSEYKQVLRLQPSNTDAKKGIERIGCK